MTCLVYSVDPDIPCKHYNWYGLRVDHVCGTQVGGNLEDDASTGEAVVAEPEHKSYNEVLQMGMLTMFCTGVTRTTPKGCQTTAK